MEKFIVTYGDRVSAIRYILASEGVYFRPGYFDITVGKIGGTEMCLYTHDWTLDEIVQDVYKKFHHRFEMYKIYATVS